MTDNEQPGPLPYETEDFLVREYTAEVDRLAADFAEMDSFQIAIAVNESRAALEQTVAGYTTLLNDVRQQESVPNEVLAQVCATLADMALTMPHQLAHWQAGTNVLLARRSG